MSLFIAGRGPLDEAAASILTHLLGKHGFAARLIGYEKRFARPNRLPRRLRSQDGVYLVP